MPKRKRQEFEEQNKDAIEAKQRHEEARRRREASISDQRELLAHILKHHSSLYELLQVHGSPLCERACVSKHACFSTMRSARSRQPADVVTGRILFFFFQTHTRHEIRARTYAVE